ncbi:FAD NAD(P)-binding domain-containing protein [Fusarium pseudocircinatum]|uniref:FAD NAD(P)-binding domain-containing protein n=1 Tax=Fusarium pseudocircinatum TaxID=56676 RepID=A0A8H5KL52_9HYPO|nr:FAD NAD(P)-binding domain-containing protein [Fusarium pseudocircinatum]
MTTLPVILIGAGVGGLAMAQFLHKTRVPFHVYEADPSLTARRQGYRIRIADEGIEAFKRYLPLEKYRTLEASCNTVTSHSSIPNAVLNALTGELTTKLFKPGANSPIPPRPVYKPLSADRGVLRQNLLEGIEDHVTFGRKYHSFTDGHEGITVHFSDGPDVQGSLLIGADGVWSRVRQQLLPSYNLLDTEARLVFGKTYLTDAFCQKFSRSASEGLTLIHGGSMKCLLEPMHFNKEIASLPEDYVYWVIFLRCDSQGIPADILSKPSDEVKTLIQSLAKDWHPSLACLFETSTTEMSVSRVLSSSPDIPDWGAGATATRVTLIGDAAHAMSPTAALGATTAIRDAAKIVDAIDQEGLNPEALRSYEHQMRAYARESLEKSLVGGKAMFGMRAFQDLPKLLLFNNLAKSCKGFVDRIGQESIDTQLIDDFMSHLNRGIEVIGNWIFGSVETGKAAIGVRMSESDTFTSMNIKAFGITVAQTARGRENAIGAYVEARVDGPLGRMMKTKEKREKEFTQATESLLLQIVQIEEHRKALDAEAKKTREKHLGRLSRPL